jgi:hypothetical protein
MVVNVSTAEIAYPVDSTRYDGSIAVQAHTKIRGFITQEFHSPGPPYSDGLRLGHGSHVRYSSNEIIRPKTVQGIGITAYVSLVPHILESKKLLCMGRLLRFIPRLLDKDRRGDPSYYTR